MQDITENAVVEASNGATKQLKSKPDGRIATLEHKVDTLIWLHSELMHKLQMAAAQQMLQNPEIQERLQAAIVAQMQKST